MPKQKKDAVLLSQKLERQINERLAKYCAETGQTKTTGIERMLQNELEKYFEQPDRKKNSTIGYKSYLR